MKQIWQKCRLKTREVSTALQELKEQGQKYK